MTLSLRNSLLLGTSAILFAACDPSPEPAPEISPQDQFFERLTLLCGKAYAGRLVSDQEADAGMAGKPMIMHAATCEPQQVQIPFHIAQDDGSWDRSRTWFLTLTVDGIRLKHRHRHEDGSLDDVTNYGGDTADEGTAERQQFPVDAESIASFEANGLVPSVHNVWAVEVSEPGQGDAVFAYELKRPDDVDGRFFRVEFDLSEPVAAPPAPW